MTAQRQSLSDLAGVNNSHRRFCNGAEHTVIKTASATQSDSPAVIGNRRNQEQYLSADKVPIRLFQFRTRFCYFVASCHQIFLQIGHFDQFIGLLFFRKTRQKQPLFPEDRQ